MATVLTASLSNRSGKGDISVTITTSFSGEGVCSFQLPGGTLADLEKVLCDPQGPIFWRYPWSHVLFYTEDEPLRPLDQQLQVSAFDSVVIKCGEMSAWLEMFPDIGKFLEATLCNKFDPSTPNFDVTWTAQSAPAVPANKVEGLVYEFLSGSPTHADSGLNFLQIFGKLTALAAQWVTFDLAMPQDSSLSKLKHCVCQHFLDVARVAATSMISEAKPILLFRRVNSGGVVGCRVIGDAFPDQFDQDLQHTFRANVIPNLDWGDISHVLLSLDWNPQEGLASLQNLMKKSKQEPCEFAALQHHEISQMVQVQLRLSCCKVAEVKGPINETCVKILAELLAYKLKTVEFQSVPDLQTQLNDFGSEANYRGTLVLVTDIPASASKTWRGPHRMVLCYSSGE